MRASLWVGHFVLAGGLEECWSTLVVCVDQRRHRKSNVLSPLNTQ